MRKLLLLFAFLCALSTLRAAVVKPEVLRSPNPSGNGYIYYFNLPFRDANGSPIEQGVTATNANPTDPAGVQQTMDRAWGNPGLISSNALPPYPIVRHDTTSGTFWYYAQYNADSSLAASTHRVGIDPPVPVMSGQVFPSGAVVQQILNQRAWEMTYYHPFGEPDTGRLIRGFVGAELAFFTGSDGDINPTVLGQPISIDFSWGQYFSHDTYIQFPGGNFETESVRHWWEIGSNGAVDFGPGTDRWPLANYVRSGILNYADTTVDGNLTIRVWQLPITTAEMQNYPGGAEGLYANYVRPMLMEQGIDVTLGDPRRPLCIVYVAEAFGATDGRAMLAGGYAQWSYYNYEYYHDLAPKTVACHELMHAIPGFFDDYHTSIQNSYDVMNIITLYYGATPYPTPNQCMMQRWRPWKFVTYGQPIDYFQAVGDTIICILNPGCSPDSLEFLAFMAIDSSLSWHPEGFYPLGLYMWHVKFKAVLWGWWETYIFPSENLIAWDGINEFWDGQQYDPWNELSSSNQFNDFPDWRDHMGSDSVIPNPIAITNAHFSGNGISYTMGVDASAPPFYVIVSLNENQVELGREWFPRFRVVNLGGPATSPVMFVTSSCPSAVPSFTAQHLGAVGTMDTVEFVAPSSVQVSGDMANLGRHVALSCAFTGANTQHCTVIVQMTSAGIALPDTFSRAPTSYDSLGNPIFSEPVGVADGCYLAIASGNIAKLYNAGVCYGQVALDGPALCVASGDIAHTSSQSLELAVYTANHSIYIFDWQTRQQLARFTNIHPTAEPLVGLVPVDTLTAQLYLTWVEGNQLFEWDINQTPPVHQDRQQTINLGFSPHSWAYGRDSFLRTGVFAFTSGNIGNGSSFIVTDAWGNHLDNFFGEFIGIEFINLGPVVIGDINNDGHIDFNFVYYNGLGHGGIKRITWSEQYESYGEGTTSLPGEVEPSSIAMSRSSSSGARLMVRTHGVGFGNPIWPLNNFSRLYIDGVPTAYFDPYDTGPSFLSSMNPIGQGGVATMCHGSQVYMVGPNGHGMYDDSPVVLDFGSATVIGSPMVWTRGAQRIMSIPIATDSCHWVMLNYASGGNADWSGQHGNSQNQNWNSFVPPPVPPMNADSLQLVVQVLSPEILQFDCWRIGYHDLPLLSFDLYYATADYLMPGSVVASIPATNDSGTFVYGSLGTPLPSQGRFCVRAVFGLDGSNYWGTFTMP